MCQHNTYCVYASLGDVPQRREFPIPQPNRGRRFSSLEEGGKGEWWLVCDPVASCSVPLSDTILVPATLSARRGVLRVCILSLQRRTNR